MMDAKRALAPKKPTQPENHPPSSPQIWEPPAVSRPKEIGGPAGLEPTRYGDWEKAGRCIDF